MKMNLIEIKETLENLSKSGITEKFYLAGGTALALKYSHRESKDLDFFSFPGEETSMENLTHLLPQEAKIINLKEHTLQFSYNNLPVSLFQYNYSLLRKPEIFEETRTYIASDEDIACMKAIAIIQRGLKKDFFDLWFLIKRHNWSISKIGELCQKKFGHIYNHSLFIKALVYFEDAESSEIPDIDLYWKEIKKFFTEIVKKDFNR
jgi:predicted nucleotidyltransferase component of viral defense system